MMGKLDSRLWLLALALAGCNPATPAGETADEAADNVEAEALEADNAADAGAEAMENAADAVREAGQALPSVVPPLRNRGVRLPQDDRTRPDPGDWPREDPGDWPGSEQNTSKPKDR